MHQRLLEACLSPRYRQEEWLATQALMCPYFVPLGGVLGADWGVVVNPESGVLVDPLSEEQILDGLRRAAALPCPNEAARTAAAGHDVRRQAERIEAILERAAGAALSITTST